MKSIHFLIVVAGCMLASCSTIKFAVPQPREVPYLAGFPVEMQGKYFSKNKDTLIINANSFQYYEASIMGPGKLNTLNEENLILKKTGEYYILNIKDSVYWEALALKLKTGRLTVYSIFYDKKTETEMIENIKAITPVNPILNRDGFTGKYYIDPGQEELQLLFDHKLFSKIMEFKKMK